MKTADDMYKNWTTKQTTIKSMKCNWKKHIWNLRMNNNILCVWERERSQKSNEKIQRKWKDKHHTKNWWICERVKQARGIPQSNIYNVHTFRNLRDFPLGSKWTRRTKKKLFIRIKKKLENFVKQTCVNRFIACDSLLRMQLW